jgi:predicted ATP-grasp superfamily ATP-dependent carboligase
MRIFLYEFITGGGWFDLGTEPPGGALLQEGRLMAAAIAEDLLATKALPQKSSGEDVKIMTLLDDRIDNFYPDEIQAIPVASTRETRSQYVASLKKCDAYLLIAPEFDGLLRRSATVAATYNAKSLIPGLSTLLVCESKLLTAEFLGLRKIPTIQTHRALDIYSPITGITRSLDSPTGFIFKHAEGAGSLGVAYYPELPTSFPEDIEGLSLGNAVIQSKVEGVFASVAAFCGPSGFDMLPPMQQIFAPDSFTYTGGRLITDLPLARRAWQLAERVFAQLPNPQGYIGVDIVMGETEEFVVEVNPRLTTSYVGYRAATEANLAEVMLGRALANSSAEVPELPSLWQGVEFDVASGTCSLTGKTLDIRQLKTA